MKKQVGFDVWLLLVVLARASEISAQGTDRCILNFTQQPVPSVDCNVYDLDLETLTCRVESIDTAGVPDVQDLSIKWFFFNDTEYDLTIGTNPVERTGGSVGHLTVTSTLHISGTSRPNATVVSEGFYYCRVHMFDASVVLHESQRFKVLHREEYLQQASSCSERTFSAALESCAVSRLSVDESTTTSILPDSTATTKTPNEENPTTTDEEPTPPSSSTVDTGSRGSGGILEVWIYVLVAVAAVFAMIIIILAIMCVGLCLRRSQILNANSLQHIHIYDAVENITEVKIGTQTEDNPAYGARNDNIELETCAAYTTGPKIDSAQMENNPAYGARNDDIDLETCPAYTTGPKIDTAQMENNPAYGTCNDNIDLETCPAYTTGPKIDTAQMKENPAYGTCNDNIDLETCPAYTTGP